MKKTIRILSVVFALMMLFAFGALATETDETPDGEQNVTEIVLPEAPTDIVADLNGHTVFGWVKVEWDAVSDADGYNFYVKEKGKWVLKQTAESNIIYVDEFLYNSKYEIGVKSYVTVGGVNYESEEICVGIFVSPTAAPKPAFLIGGEGSMDGLRVFWKKIDGVSGYRLYIKQDEKWVKLKDIYGNKNIEYIYTAAVDGEKYEFALKTFVKGTEGLKFSKLVRSYYIYYNDPKKVDFHSSIIKSTSVELGWSTVKGASGYRIYMYQGGKWKALKTTTKTEYTVTGLEASKKYIFRARAYKKVNGVTEWYPLSNNHTVITKSKTVEAYRIKNLQKSFSDGDWYIKLKNIGDGNGGKCTVTLAGKGDNLFYKYDYGNGLEIKYLYLDSKERLYAISDADKEYVIVPEDEAEYLVELMYAMSELLKVQNVGKVTAKTEYYNGKTAVAETYKDTKYGFKKTYYFVNDKVVGALVEYDSIEESYSSFSVKDTPASYLFKVPSGYKKVSW
ncbi:MAG: hypothetical protein IKJ27_11170 [Clostridia bacterium]|nr:hypothetical protein [Clostridia bacterium]